MSAYQAKLGELLEDLYEGDVPDLIVGDLSLDNRNVASNGLFVALKGERIDARNLIAQTLEKGVVAVVYDDDSFELEESIKNKDNVIPIKQLPEKLSVLAARFYDHPSKNLTVIGVTGTNGKTTIAHLLTQILGVFGEKPSFIGTLGAGFLGELKNTGMTTPDAIEVQKLLAKFKDAGARIICMEVSSHALALGRVTAIDFDVVVFTNLSLDHLDFHQNIASYQAAKRQLFDANPQASSVINADDRFGKTLIGVNNKHTKTYGIQAGELRAVTSQISSQGISFTLKHGDETHQINSPLVGKFNINNLLAVIGVCIQLGYKLNDVAACIADCKAVPGRMERIGAMTETPVVIVDFAHTPDALTQSLLACKAHCKGKLSVVFGCGGDRDKTKRAQMGEIAQRLADHVYLTDDNPRSENPKAIMRDIVKNLNDFVRVIHDRRQAIEIAIENAAVNDWVLVAGKGHESQQIFKDHVIDFDDRKVSQASLNRVRA